MYDKHKYFKANNKKVLHKVKKQWVTISLALLMAIGGGVAATHISASADTNNQLPATNVSEQTTTSLANNIQNQAIKLHTSLVSASSNSSTLSSASINHVHTLGAMPDNIEHGNWGTANYQFDNNTGAFTAENGKVTSDSSWHGALRDDLNIPSANVRSISLDNITLPNNSSQLFKDLPNLTSINFHNMHTSNVTNMQNMLESDTNLGTIIFPQSFDTSHVTSMGWLFCNDFNLKNLVLSSSFNMQNVTNTKAMFYGEGTLQSLTIQSPNINFSHMPLPIMYKKLSNNTYASEPTNFDNGASIGTYVNPNIVKRVNPNTNPNEYMANENQEVTDPIWDQNYHFNDFQGRNNDIESIIPHYNNGKIDYWDIYYLWDPAPNDPAPYAYEEWAAVRTKNLSTYQPVDQSDPDSLNNIAIPNPAYEINGHNRVEVKPSDNVAIPWEQPAGGSVISNKKANGGQWLTQDIFGNPISSDARLAYFANYEPNNYGDYLAYANPIYTNGQVTGYHQFRPYSETNIFTGDVVGVGKEGDFRDPSVIINPKDPNQLVAYCAGGASKRVYEITSNDAIHWHEYGYVDVSNAMDNLVGSGTALEAPDVTEINNQPMVLFSIQGTTKQPNYNKQKQIVAYVTGEFDNNGIFHTTSNSKFGTFDLGYDVYAGDIHKIDNNHLMFVGWLNNWTYFTQLHEGGLTSPRILSWNGNTITTNIINPALSKNSDKVSTNTYYPNGLVNIDFNKPTNSFDIKLNRSNNTNNYVDFNFSNGNLTVTRNGSAKDTNNIMNETKSSTINTNSLSNIQFYLDNDSIAAYFPDTQQVDTVLDYDATRNTPYVLTGVPSQAKVTSNQFNVNQSQNLEDINQIINKFNNDKTDLTNDWNALNTHTNESLNTSKSLLNDYFGTIQNAITNAKANINQVNNYSKDSRQHTFIALANNNMNMANTKLYQAGIQLQNLNDAATPYLDASAANQQKANQAAQKADQKIAQQQRTSVANSVAAANKAKANHAAQVADQNILNQQKQSVANSVNAVNQRTATSAANSADKSIESSIANSYAKSADTSIVNSYKNSASASVSAADQSIENSIANSYRNSVNNSVAVANQSKARSASSSADQSIASSEAAKNASQQISSQSQQSAAPFIPMDNVIPTPTAITSNSVTNNSNNDSVMSNNSSDLNSSVTTSSNVSKNVKRRASKLVMKKSSNNQIPLLGLAKRTYFYQHDEAFVFTNRMKKHANVLQVTVWPNHHVIYRVRIGKPGYMYGYLKKLAKPELFTKRNMYIHVGKRMIKLPMRRFNRIKINRAVRYAGKNYVKYYVNYGRKHGVIYGKLPKIAKRVRTNKGIYSKYYQVIPKRYHYVNVRKPLLIYNNKHFTKRNYRGSIRKGITIRVKRLVRDGKMTRFELMNGCYITGLKNFVKLVK